MVCALLVQVELYTTIAGRYSITGLRLTCECTRFPVNAMSSDRQIRPCMYCTAVLSLCWLLRVQTCVKNEYENTPFVKNLPSVLYQYLMLEIPCFYPPSFVLPLASSLWRVAQKYVCKRKRLICQKRRHFVFWNDANSTAVRYFKEITNDWCMHDNNFASRFSNNIIQKFSLEKSVLKKELHRNTCILSIIRDLK